jgi:hypothetical protein
MALHALRVRYVQLADFAGMSSALRRDMANRLESWTIPLHVVMWTALSVGMIMVMVVILMN